VGEILAFITPLPGLNKPAYLNKQGAALPYNMVPLTGLIRCKLLLIIAPKTLQTKFKSHKLKDIKRDYKGLSVFKLATYKMLSLVTK
jgi:hypothetical protein